MASGTINGMLKVKDISGTTNNNGNFLIPDFTGQVVGVNGMRDSDNDTIVGIPYVLVDGTTSIHFIGYSSTYSAQANVAFHGKIYYL